jgi:hypothetical protein
MAKRPEESNTAVVIQVVVTEGIDAYRLLRDKVTHEAATWFWHNKAKTRLRHINSTGYVEIGSAEGVLVARIFPKKREDLYFLTEKLIGRLVAWFEHDLGAVNIQFLEGSRAKK